MKLWKWVQLFPIKRRYKLKFWLTHIHTFFTLILNDFEWLKLSSRHKISKSSGKNKLLQKVTKKKTYLTQDIFLNILEIHFLIKNKWNRNAPYYPIKNRFLSKSKIGFIRFYIFKYILLSESCIKLYNCDISSWLFKFKILKTAVWEDGFKLFIAFSRPNDGHSFLKFQLIS